MYLFFWGPREGNACDDKRQGVVCQPARYKAMDVLVLTWQVEMHLSFTVNRGLSIRMVSFAVNPGRHLHLQGHQETLVNKVLKPNHVRVTWHLKKNVIKFLSRPSVCSVLTTPSKQHRLNRKGRGSHPTLAVGSERIGTTVWPDRCEYRAQTEGGVTAGGPGGSPITEK